jgi:signal transduction histidine kinase/CheY-like chemotaxis protein
MIGQGVRRPILATVVLWLFVLLAGFLGGSWWLQSRYMAAEFESRISATKQLLSEALHADLSALGAAATVLRRDEPLLELWQRGDRDALLRYARPLAEELRANHAITHLDFHSPDGRNFLRVHDPARFGDTIARYTLRHTAETGKPTSGIEMGPLGTFTLRLVQPCSLRGAPIGYLELGIDIQHLTESLRKIVRVDALILVDKRYLDRNDWEAGARKVGHPTDWDLLPNMAVLDSTFQTIPQVLLDALHDGRLTPATSRLEMTVAGQSCLTAMLPLKDIRGRIVGWTLICDDVSAAKLRPFHTVLSLVASGLFLGALILGFAWVHLGRLERQLNALHQQTTAENAARERYIEEIRIERDALEAKTAVLAEVSLAAQAATKAKTEFLANMSHEIRTPITAILGYADVMLDEDLEHAIRQHAEVIRRNGEHLLGLINDILDLSKVEAGRMQIEPIRCSPVQVVAEVVSLMRVRAEAKHLTLQTDLAGPLPDTVLTDPLRLRQVLVNLVGNAIKFTDQGEVSLVVRLIADQGCPRLRFDVTDTGIGINEEHLKRLFQPFTQVDTSSTRRFGGTGLGLCISKRLTEALGGSIEVHSTPGKGSSFSVTIDPGPLDGIRMLENVQDALLDYMPRTTSATSGKTECCGRVLLAEDALDNQRLIGLLLKKAGNDVVTVENGEQAVEEASVTWRQGRPFDVILMDMQMPVMDGYSATSRLREQGYTRPIIALTAHAMAEDRQKCLDAGCDDYATKPIDRQRLLATIARWMVGRQTNGDWSGAAVGEGCRAPQADASDCGAARRCSPEVSPDPPGKSQVGGPALAEAGLFHSTLCPHEIVQLIL